MALRPKDDDYDDMHHALGRPKNYRPGMETFRNHYCCEVDCATSKRFEALGWWNKATIINSGRDAVWIVNDAGKLALAKWLAAHTQQ